MKKSLNDHMEHVRAAVHAHAPDDHQGRFVTLQNGITDRVIELGADAELTDAEFRAQVIDEAKQNKAHLIKVASDAIFGGK